MREHCVFPLDWAKFYAAEIALALDHVHGKGFVYRDLKLENVLITLEGHVKLGDFGMARRMGDAQSAPAAGRAVAEGTELAMAPEVLKHQPYDGAADRWALGVLLCELHLGGTPMPSTIGGLLEAFEEGTHLDGMPETVDDSMRACVEALLTVDVERRVRSLALLQACRLFADVDWQAMAELQLAAPLAPFLARKKRRRSKGGHEYMTARGSTSTREADSAMRKASTPAARAEKLADLEKRFTESSFALERLYVRS